MADDQRYVTRSGLSAMLQFEAEQNSPRRDAWDRWYRVWTADSTEERVCVRFLAPVMMDMHLQSLGRGGFEQNKATLGLLAVLANFDSLTELPSDPHGNRILEVPSEDAAQLLDPPKQSDRQIRRFLTRRIYDASSRSTLTIPCAIRTLDALICGATLDDFLRNAQLLEEEGYLKIEATAPDGLAVLPRAKLVREVERYGASREDAAEQADILAAIAAYPGLRRHEGAISLEYRRYAAARTSVELESVFRAVAPIVEDVVKDVLNAHGSTAQHSTLGPAIADLRQRGFGNLALWSQLSHVIKFARDLAQHGSALSEPVLRIACENCFQLLPQLGALYP